jgi:uncharacterized protein
MADLIVSDHSFEQFLAAGQLMGVRCSECAAIWVPPRALCPDCHKGDMQWLAMSGTGKLVAFTSIFIGPPWMVEQGFDRQHPYCTGVVELDEGPRVVARIDGVDASQPQSIEIGLALRVNFDGLTSDASRPPSDQRPRLVFKPLYSADFRGSS